MMKFFLTLAVIALIATTLTNAAPKDKKDKKISKEKIPKEIECHTNKGYFGSPDKTECKLKPGKKEIPKGWSCDLQEGFINFETRICEKDLPEGLIPTGNGQYRLEKDAEEPDSGYTCTNFLGSKTCKKDKKKDDEEEDKEEEDEERRKRESFEEEIPAAYFNSYEEFF